MRSSRQGRERVVGARAGADRRRATATSSGSRGSGTRRSIGSRLSSRDESFFEAALSGWPARRWRRLAGAAAGPSLLPSAATRCSPTAAAAGRPAAEVEPSGIVFDGRGDPLPGERQRRRSPGGGGCRRGPLVVPLRLLRRRAGPPSQGGQRFRRRGDRAGPAALPLGGQRGHGRPARPRKAGVCRRRRRPAAAAAALRSGGAPFRRHIFGSTAFPSRRGSGIESLTFVPESKKKAGGAAAGHFLVASQHPEKSGAESGAVYRFPLPAPPFAGLAEVALQPELPPFRLLPERAAGAVSSDFYYDPGSCRLYVAYDDDSSAVFVDREKGEARLTPGSQSVAVFALQPGGLAGAKPFAALGEWNLPAGRGVEGVTAWTRGGKTELFVAIDMSGGQNPGRFADGGAPGKARSPGRRI